MSLARVSSAKSVTRKPGGTFRPKSSAGPDDAMPRTKAEASARPRLRRTHTFITQTSRSMAGPQPGAVVIVGLAKFLEFAACPLAQTDGGREDSVEGRPGRPAGQVARPVLALDPGAPGLRP